MSVVRTWSGLLGLLVVSLAACGGDEGGTPDDGSGGNTPDGGGSDVDAGPVDTGGADAYTGGGEDADGGADADSGAREDADSAVPQPDGGLGDGGGGVDGDDEADGEQADADEGDGGADPGDATDGSAEPDRPVGVASLLFFTPASGSNPPSLSAMSSTGAQFNPPVSLRPFIDLPAAGGRTGTFAVDVTGDGHDDLVVWDGASRDGAGGIRVNAGDGAGGIEAPTFWWSASRENPTPGGDSNGFAGDVDGDGRADLILWSGATAPPDRGNILVLRSSGTTFEPSELGFTPTGDVLVPRLNGSERAGDFNGDGRTDLVAIFPSDGPNNGAVQIAYAGDDGYTGFVNGQASDWGRVPPVGQALLVADVNGDGFDDLINLFETRPPGTAGGVNVALGSAAGLQSPTAWYSGNLMERFVPQAATAWVALDVNDDGSDDLVNVFGFTPGGPGSVGVMLSDGNAFGPSTGWFGTRDFGVPNTPFTFAVRL